MDLPEKAAPNSGADAVRALRILVVVMGILLVGGFFALVVSIAYMAKHRQAAAPAASTVSAPYAAFPPFAAPAIDLPAGARIEMIAAGADRLVLHLVLADGNRELLVLDLSSGRRLGTIPLRTAP